MWPDWIGRILGRFTPRPFKVRLETKLGEKPRAWQTKRFNLTVARFCRTCNNTWMSDMEDKVKPILEPMMLGKAQTAVLSPRDQVVLSRWAFKMALVADLVLPGPRLIPQEWYKNFYRDHLPPEIGAVIWTTAYGGREKAAHTYRRLLVIPPIGEVMGWTETHGFLITFDTFRAVFQVLGYFGGRWQPTGDGGIESQRYLIRLWPPTATAVGWPRNGLALSDSAFLNFPEREDFI